MDWYGKCDEKLLLKFAQMKENDEPRILVISGPFSSGKSTLVKMLEKYTGTKSIKMDIYTLKQNIYPLPNYRKILHIVDVHAEKNIRYVFQQCRAVLLGEKTFRSLFQTEQRSFVGNQCIIEVLSSSPTIIEDERVIVLNLQKSEKIPKEKLNFSDFHYWIIGLDRACREVLTFILAAKKSELLLKCPKDILRLLVTEVMKEPYRLYFNRDFCALRVKW